MGLYCDVCYGELNHTVVSCIHTVVVRVDGGSGEGGDMVPACIIFLSTTKTKGYPPRTLGMPLAQPLCTTTVWV